MIWHYFPIGMRFPVNDFSADTKRACWQIALSAAYASDPCGTGLYEACEPFDPISQSPVYTCIVCYVGIKQSRTAGETLHTLDALMTRLCLCNPLVQANYLESFGPYPILAEIDPEKNIHPSEDGIPFIPTEPVTSMRRTNGCRVLIAPDSVQGVCDAERLTRVLGTAAAEHGLRVRRMPIADGGEGTVRTLVSGAGGRYETVSCDDLNGERIGMTVGVIPGKIAVLEAADAVGLIRKNEQTPPIGRRSSFAVGMLIKKTLDLGYRRIWIGLGDTQTTDMGLGALSALGFRFFDADGEQLTPCPETLARIASIDRTELDARIAQTELTLLYDAAASLYGQNGALRLFGTQEGASEGQIDAWEKEFIRLASMLQADPSAPGSGAGGGLGFALASVGGILRSGSEMILNRIGLSSALHETDFAIIGKGISQSICRENASAGMPGCLLVGKLDTDADALLRENHALKGIAVCPVGDEPCETTVKETFERTILPLIAKSVANTAGI